jgi:hypothetical protein
MVLRVNQFCWIALVLAAFGAAIFAAQPTALRLGELPTPLSIP